MSKWGLIWLLPFVYIATAEVVAIFDKTPNNTLSAHVWKWMGTGWGWERILTLGFLTWLVVHFVWEGLRFKGYAR